MLLQPQPASAQEGKEPEAKSDDWLVYYYLNPRPEQTTKFIRQLSRDGVFDDENARPPLVAFFSRVFAANPDRLRAWFAELDSLPADDKRVVWMALWYAGTPEATAQLRLATEKASLSEKRELAKLIESRAPALDEIEIKEPGTLDMLWGAFMATGDGRYVVRLMSVLPWAEQKADLMKAMLGGVARWSLESNAVQHDRVLQICKEQLGKQPEDVRRVLSGVIREAEEERGKRDAKK